MTEIKSRRKRSRCSARQIPDWLVVARVGPAEESGMWKEHWVHNQINDILLFDCYSIIYLK